MQALPHKYPVKATGKSDTNLILSVANLADLVVAPPEQFGGPGNEWSPESLLMASISSCFILSFKAIARASKLSWISIECHSEGILDRVDGITQFTTVTTKANLVVAANESIDKAETLLHKADKSCLVANSLSTKTVLECVVTVED